MSLPVTLLAPQSDATARVAIEPWHLALRQAGSRAEAMAVVNDFISQCDEDALGELPDGCRPWKTITDVVERGRYSTHSTENSEEPFWFYVSGSCSPVAGSKTRARTVRKL